MKRSRINPKRRAPRRTRSRDHGDMGNTWAMVYARQGAACWLCPRPMAEAHHRQTRRFGPDCPANIIGLCDRCHHVTVHGHPATALTSGWIISRHYTDPCGVPVADADGALWILTCEGTIIRHRPLTLTKETP